MHQMQTLNVRVENARKAYQGSYWNHIPRCLREQSILSFGWLDIYLTGDKNVSSDP